MVRGKILIILVKSLHHFTGLNLRWDSLYSIGFIFIAYGVDVTAISAKKELFKRAPRKIQTTLIRSVSEATFLKS
jgi:hypothetical protein